MKSIGRRVMTPKWRLRMQHYLGGMETVNEKPVRKAPLWIADHGMNKQEGNQ